jgi:hypothetical protein
MIYEETHGQFDCEDDVYHFLEDKFAPRKLVSIGKEDRWLSIKLKELEANEFGETVMKVQQWATEALGLVIPDPNQQWELKHYQDQ